MTIPTFLDSPDAIERHLYEGISSADLAQPGVRFILCDSDNQVVLHVQVDNRGRDDLEPLDIVDPDDDDGLGDGPDATITRFVRGVVDTRAMPNRLLIALTRPGRPILVEADRACYRAARAVCAEQDVRLLGVHVVTPRGQRAVTLDDAL